MVRVFLGGTCNESTWRNKMMAYLHDLGLEYFNPVVDDWDENAQANELKERAECDFCLYAITPKMTGAYSVAEVIDDSNKRPEKTILVLLHDDGDNKFTEGQWKSLKSVAKMVKRNGGQVFDNLYFAALHCWKMTQ
ncbi:MAG: nucleoside 2-deoxyribosyltransferase domain-containing protein [bacterium]